MFGWLKGFGLKWESKKKKKKKDKLKGFMAKPVFLGKEEVGVIVFKRDRRYKRGMRVYSVVYRYRRRGRAKVQKVVRAYERYLRGR